LTNQNFGGALATPALPSLTPLVGGPLKPGVWGLECT